MKNDCTLAIVLLVIMLFLIVTSNIFFITWVRDISSTPVRIVEQYPGEEIEHDPQVYPYTTFEVLGSGEMFSIYNSNRYGNIGDIIRIRR
jgi:hypothetical protein